MISTIDLLNLSVVGIVLLVNSYAAYFAFGIRRVLAVGPYRNQALGNGLVAFALAVWLLARWTEVYLGGGLFAPTPGLVTTFGALLAFMVLFYWIDAAVLAGKRSDPVLRDTLHWSKVRIILWIVIITGFVSYITVNSFIQFFVKGTPTQAEEWAYNAVGPFGLFGILIPLLAGALVLPVISLRSGDKQLRSHIRWFGMLAIAFMIFYIVLPLPLFGNNLILQGALTQNAGFILGGYFLYRGALSLVPLKKRS